MTEIATDTDTLTLLNDHFIQACRLGSWEMLRVILGDDFQYLDGLTGEQWDLPRYVDDLQDNPAPTLVIDELAVHVAGDMAAVSGRASSSERQGRGNRYLDSYARRNGQWVCVHACVWPLPGSTGTTGDTVAP